MNLQLNVFCPLTERKRFDRQDQEQHTHRAQEMDATGPWSMNCGNPLRAKCALIQARACCTQPMAPTTGRCPSAGQFRRSFGGDSCASVILMIHDLTGNGNCLRPAVILNLAAQRLDGVRENIQQRFEGLGRATV